MHLKIESIYKGPNIYSSSAAIHLIINFENENSRFIGDQAISVLNEIVPIDRNNNEVGFIFEQLIIHLMQTANEGNIFHKLINQGTDKSTHIIYGYRERVTGIACAQLSLAIIETLLSLPSELQSEESTLTIIKKMIEQFEYNSYNRGLGRETNWIVNATEKKSIPWRRISSYSSAIQLGHGKFQKKFIGSVSSQTEYIGDFLARYKPITNHLYNSLAIPIALQQIAENEAESIKAANRIGYPVVVKPINGGKGLGITVHLTKDDELIHAYKNARQYSARVIVEKYISGDDHRLTVVGGELISAHKRIPAHVTGDGKHTIKQLIEIINQDPNRGVGSQKLLVKIKIDDEVKYLLSRKGYNIKSVLPKNEIVNIRRTANISTGGTAIDVTNIIHPDNSLLAIRSAKAVGLDVAGIDLITPDITRSYKEVQAAIIEANSWPGLNFPNNNKLHTAILDQTLKTGVGRIPIITVMEGSNCHSTLMIMSHILSSLGHTVAQTGSNGVFINKDQICQTNSTDWDSVQFVFREPTSDIALIEISTSEVMGEGLGFDSANISIILNVEIDDSEMKNICGLTIDYSNDLIILNADDSLCIELGQNIAAEKLCYISQRPDNKLVEMHINDGNTAFCMSTTKNNTVLNYYQNNNIIEILNIADVNKNFKGKNDESILGLISSIAACTHIGKSIESIVESLS